MSNKNRRLLAVGALLLVGLLGVLQVQAQTWELVWSDEFDVDGAPDPSQWVYQVGGGGYGNNELQFYTDNRRENARIEDGTLIIEARREDYGGNGYTSARLNAGRSQGWLYGRFEFRAKLPVGRGTWPALWMMPVHGSYGNGSWPDNGEIDIMEHVGYDPSFVSAATHTSAFNHRNGNNPSGRMTGSDFETEFHTYVLEWAPNVMHVYVDDARIFTSERGSLDWTGWPFDKPFYMILNVAVGGDWGGQQGVDDSAFPTRMEVDYVRVYRDATARPTVEIDLPGDVVQYPEGDTIPMSATATDASHGLERVTFYQGDGVLASFTEPPFEFALENAASGCYEVHARAENSSGWFAHSDTVTVQVGESCFPAPYLMTAPELPGRIEAEYYDLGGQGVAYSDLDPVNRGNGIRQSEGVEIGISEDLGGGFHVEQVTRREWVSYTFHVSRAGRYIPAIRTSALSSGSIDVEIDGEPLAESFAYVMTGNLNFFRTNRQSGIELNEGKHTIKLKFQNVGVRLNWFEFVTDTATSTGQQSQELPSVSAEIYPNPLRGVANVRFDNPRTGPVSIDVFDLLGRRVLSVPTRIVHSGTASIRLDTSDLIGGSYFVQIRTESTSTVLPVSR